MLSTDPVFFTTTKSIEITPTCLNQNHHSFPPLAGHLHHKTEQNNLPTTKHNMKSCR